MNKLIDGHYTYFNSLVEAGVLTPPKVKMVIAIILGLFLYLLGCSLRRRLNSEEKIKKEIIRVENLLDFHFSIFL